MTAPTDCRHCPADRLKLVEISNRLEALCKRDGASPLPLGEADARGLRPIVPSAECPEKEGQS